MRATVPIPLQSRLSLTLTNNLKFPWQLKLDSGKLSPSAVGIYWRSINRSLGISGAALLEACADGSSFLPPSTRSKGSLRHFSMKPLWANPKGLSSCYVYPIKGVE